MSLSSHPFVSLQTRQRQHTMSLSSFFFCEEDNNSTVCHRCPLLVLSCRSVGRKMRSSAQLFIVFFFLVVNKTTTTSLSSFLFFSCKQDDDNTQCIHLFSCCEMDNNGTMCHHYLLLVLFRECIERKMTNNM